MWYIQGPRDPYCGECCMVLCDIAHAIYLSVALITAAWSNIVKMFLINAPSWLLWMTYPTNTSKFCPRRLVWRRECFVMSSGRILTRLHSVVRWCTVFPSKLWTFQEFTEHVPAKFVPELQFTSLSGWRFSSQVACLFFEQTVLWQTLLQLLPLPSERQCLANLLGHRGSWQQWKICHRLGIWRDGDDQHTHWRRCNV